MIAPMIKYSFLVYHQSYLDFIDRLGDVGVVHVQQKAEGTPDDEVILQKLRLIQQIDEVLKFLKSRKVEVGEVESALHPDDIIKQVKYFRLKLDLKQTDLQIAKKEFKQLKPWGKFSWDVIEKLEEAGRYLSFFRCNKSKFDIEWENDYQLFKMGIESSNVLFVIVSDSKNIPDIKAELLKLPRKSVDVLNETQRSLEMEIEKINDQLNHFAESALMPLNKMKQKVKSEIDFRSVVLQGSDEADSKLKLIEGWVPEAKEEALVSILDDQGIYFVKSEPGVEDDVPILLKNNAFTKLFELVGSLYSLPNYREIDLTPFFAPFFMLFFGFCLGDAGYGLLIVVVTLFLRARAKPNMKPVWALGAFFGLATIVMGLVGGTVFGIMLVDVEANWLSSFKNMILDQNQLMYFSIALGVIQIVFGMCLKVARAIKIYGLKYALSTIGWIIVIVGVGGSYGLSLKGILDVETARYLMVAWGSIGGIMVLFFNSPGKNIFLNFGLGLWDAYGTVTGMLGDVLSYIRLFALGLSSAVLGNVFNQLAFDLTGDIPVLSPIFTIIILLLGHSINFFMAALGAFVHPLRLTFVEFYKNTGFSGGGKKYSPFRKIEEVKYS